MLSFLNMPASLHKGPGIFKWLSGFAKPAVAMLAVRILLVNVSTSNKKKV